MKRLRVALLLLCVTIGMVCAQKHFFAEPFASSTTYSVNMPFESKYSCGNFCGPTAKCAITGEQCFADPDCQGCQPPPYMHRAKTCIPGSNYAGKSTGTPPTQSILTNEPFTGYEPFDRAPQANDRAPQANFGVDTWGASFNEQQSLFNRRYMQRDTSSYQPAYSLTGTFVAVGPEPSP